MAEDPAPFPPAPAPPGPRGTAAAQRAERLAAALRENLRRRKAQARAQDQARAKDQAGGGSAENPSPTAQETPPCR